MGSCEAVKVIHCINIDVMYWRFFFFFLLFLVNVHCLLLSFHSTKHYLARQVNHLLSGVHFIKIIQNCKTLFHKIKCVNL